MEAIEEGPQTREAEIEVEGWIFVESNCEEEGAEKPECESADKVGREPGGRGLGWGWQKIMILMNFGIKSLAYKNEIILL